MNQEQVLFDEFFTEVTGITDINQAEYSPSIKEATLEQINTIKSIGNINIIRGNIRTIPEANEIVEKFLTIKLP